MSILPLQIISITADLILFVILVYYFWNLRTREKELAKKEGKVDGSYHQIVDDALTKERKILEDATNEANQIVTGAHYIQQNSQKTVDQALEKMVVDVKGETADTANAFRTTYQSSLDTIANQSLTEFQNVTKELKGDLQKQLKQFHETLLPALEKEVEEYKQTRLKQAEQTITNIIQEASQDILNKSISFEDHQRLMIESLEKAKKEGLFE